MDATNNDDGDLLSVLLVPLPDPEVDPEVAEKVTRQLRAELNDLAWETLETVSGPPAPANAKGDPVTVGALVLGLSATGGVLPTLIGTVRDWLGRQSGKHRIAITIDGDTIELGRATAEEQRQLVDTFVRNHSE